MTKQQLGVDPACHDHERLQSAALMALAVIAAGLLATVYGFSTIAGLIASWLTWP